MTLVEVSSSKETCSHGEISKLKMKNRSTQYKTKQNATMLHTHVFMMQIPFNINFLGVVFFLCVCGGRVGGGERGQMPTNINN